MKLAKEDSMELLVDRKTIYWIACNYQLSTHAKVRMLRRDKALTFDLKDRISHALVGWKTSTGCLAIALDWTHYIVVDTSKAIDTGKPLVVTFVDTSTKKTNVLEKLFLEYKSSQVGL